jgi:hypothetical protein
MKPEFKKVDLGSLIWKYDMSDALIVICYKNLKRLRNFGYMGTDRNLATNRGIAQFFSANFGILGDMGPPPVQFVDKFN